MNTQPIHALVTLPTNNHTLTLINALSRQNRNFTQGCKVNNTKETKLQQRTSIFCRVYHWLQANIFSLSCLEEITVSNTINASPLLITVLFAFPKVITTGCKQFTYDLCGWIIVNNDTMGGICLHYSMTKKEKTVNELEINSEKYMW